MKNFAKIFFAAFFLAIFLSVFFSRTQKPAEEIFIAEPTFSNDIYLPAAAFVPTTAPTQTPAPTPEPTPTPEPKFFSARIANVGDFMCHQVQLDAAYDKTGGVYDFDPCFKYIKPYIADADYAVGNLETTLAGGASSGYPIFNSPDAYAAAIKNAGFDFVTTANNHGNDKREAGIVRTIETLNGVGLAFTGTNLS
ncbi:MAG: CapA family protein, partial [Defluviitaleaceae bacterium]|nr:CapA family protein [Defluviitaleaceae bacterium]